MAFRTCWAIAALLLACLVLTSLAQPSIRASVSNLKLVLNFKVCIHILDNWLCCVLYDQELSKYAITEIFEKDMHNTWLSDNGPVLYKLFGPANF